MWLKVFQSLPITIYVTNKEVYFINLVRIFQYISDIQQRDHMKKIYFSSYMFYGFVCICELATTIALLSHKILSEKVKDAIAIVLHQQCKLCL